MNNDINEVRERLHTEANAYAGGQVFAQCRAEDVNALLTAPPGYVLLPTDPGNMQLMWVGGHDEASQRRAYAGLLASAPEVK